MKKKLMRIAAIFIVAALMLALVAACRNETDDERVMPEYVYIPEIVELPEGISGVQGVAYAGGTVFLAVEYQHQDEETFTFETRLYKLDLNTNVISALENYSTPKPYPDAQGWINVTIGTGPDGNLWVSETGSFWRLNIPDDFDGEEDETWQFHEDLGSISAIRKLDSTGAEISKLNLEAISQGSNWFNINSFQVDGDGNIYISAQGDSSAFGDQGSAIFVLDSDGNTLFNIIADGWGQFIHLADGSVAHFGFEDDVEFGFRRVFRPIDLSTQSFGDPIETPDNVWDVFPGNEDFDFLFIQNTDLYGFNVDSEEPEFLLNWVDSDVTVTGNATVALLGDGRVLTFSQRWGVRGGGSTFEVVLLTRTPSADLPEKSIITLATLWVSSDLQSAVVDFNRSSTTHRVRVTDYSQFNTEDDWTAGLTRLSTEIISGVVPDIISVNGLPVRQYAARGILEDLYQFIDADPELSRDSFVEGVLEAAEMDGQLFQIFPSFGVNTLMGHPAVLGPEPGWNMEEFRAVLAANPDADLPMGHFTRDSFLNQAVMLGMDQYVDWARGEVHFETDEFAQLLEFAGTFPADFDDSDMMWRGGGDTDLIAQGRQIMSPMSIWDFWSLQMQYALFGGELVFKGFPTESRNGNSIDTQGGLAITTSAPDRDGAWSFVRTLLLEDFQLDNVWGFPTNRAAFNVGIEDVMTTQEGSHFMGFGDGASIELVALTQAQIDPFMELIRSTAGISGWDTVIMDIVSEGAGDFFGGRSSARDAARVIQSRVSTYIHEQS